MTGLIQVTTYAAVDGQALDFDQDLKSRINPWNFQHLGERKLRGVVGCALSHLGVWQQIARLSDRFAFVFEDDARLIKPELVCHLMHICRNLPAQAELVWLNDWDRGASKAQRFKTKIRSMLAPALNPVLVKWRAVTEKTTEAYLLTPKFAAALYDQINTDMGAVDEQMRGLIAHRSSHCYSASPPIFTQADRRETDIHLK